MQSLKEGPTEVSAQIISIYNYRLFGYYPSSCFLFKNNISDTRLCLHPQVKAYSAHSIDLVPISGPTE
jgi:hypothetical protein